MWNVESVLSSVKLPLGPDFVPDARVRMPHGPCCFLCWCGLLRLDPPRSLAIEE